MLGNKAAAEHTTGSSINLFESEFEMMTLEPHQQRVVDEKKELDEKATKLSNFIGTNPIFAGIHPDEQERLKEQCEIMWQYSEILGKRIAAFTG
jgi:septum formation inhibitor MinC